MTCLVRSELHFLQIAPIVFCHSTLVWFNISFKSLNMYSSALLILLALSCNVQAQTSSSAYVEPTVPTGTPLPGDYSGALRPQLHYSPPVDFMVSTNQCTCLAVAWILLRDSTRKERQ